MASHFLAATTYGVVLKTTTERLGAYIDAAIWRPDLYLVLVAERGPREHDAGAVCGFLALVDVENPITGENYADEIVWWVEPGYRGALKAGPALLDAAEAWATAKGLTLIKMVAPWGSRVGRFYLRHGYRPIEIAYAKTLPKG